jgi:energy-coupling factor transporter ATP-binding protein EcfA2
MKLKRVRIEHFKCIRELEMDFAVQGGDGLRPLTLLVGDNGSGKTTVLQAIAYVLSRARMGGVAPPGLWTGFLPERISSLGKTKVDMLVSFSPAELDVLNVSMLDRARKTGARAPLVQGEVRLLYAEGGLTSPDGPFGVAQFAERRRIEEQARTEPSLRERLKALGDVFWFDQYRSLGTTSLGAGPPGQVSWEAGVQQMREFLIGQYTYHVSTKKGAALDLIPELESRLAGLFPGVRFAGIEPKANVAMPKSKDFYFLLASNGKRFDIAEMSSGEQALFVLLCDFVRMNIAHSIVLIDELELHLHPPQQQAILAALPKIGPDCQFIVTTHSDYIAGVIPNEEIIRLPGGRPCL